ncbi:DEAD/DEAH box helicase [Enterococcus songbeiensis]|uniref:DEAD/DEAH box helicase n=1 Tax=Enterococcus songbeiensis TaxID=2559927 RepID=UPI0010F4491F|nr:DEAD/DEAH box helicase [Enterococcus songbeiensis]
MNREELPEAWQKRWTDQAFQEPTKIQQQVFAPLKNHETIVGISPTGSGKTLAYLLPLLLNVEKDNGNQLLILTSSQELAVQVTDVANIWAKDIDLRVQSLIGGANVKRQIEKLKEKPEVLIGTPGRVIELMKARKLKSHLLRAVVLDEADQMLQKGSTELVTEIVKQLQKETQLAFFSATADAAITEIATLIDQVPTVIDVTKEDDSKGVIHHYFLRYPGRKRVDALRRLAYLDSFRGLIFFNQLTEMGNAEEKLLYHGVPVASLASDQSKQSRKLALGSFREGKIVELLTTDLAARGLDITDLPFVINAEVPLTKESYLHRAGRVGRMGKTGTVITILQDNQMRDLQRLAKELGLTIEEIFLHGGALQTTPPISQTEKPKKAPTVFAKKLEIHEKIATTQEKRKKSLHKKRKSQKDKGKRRK